MNGIAVDGDGALAAAVVAALTAIGRINPAHASLPPSLIMVADTDVAALVERVRRAEAVAIVVLVDGNLAAIDAHLMLAAIAPLGIERAPQCRVSAVHVIPDANPVDVAAAIGFLIDAVSVTGQVIRVDPQENTPF